MSQDDTTAPTSEWAAVDARIAQAVARSDEFAKTLLSTMALVGTVISGFGLVTGATTQPSGIRLILLFLAVMLAVWSVSFALYALKNDVILPPALDDPSRQGAVDDVVRDVLQQQQSNLKMRMDLLKLASASLIVSVGTGGSAAVLGMIQRDHPVLAPTLSVVPDEGDHKVTLAARGTGFNAGETVTAWSVLVADDGTQTVITQVVTQVGSKGAVTLTSEAKVGPGREVQAHVRTTAWECDGTVALTPQQGRGFAGPEGLHCAVPSGS